MGFANLKQVSIIGQVGTPVFFDDKRDGDPGVVQKIFEFTVPSGKTRTLNFLKISHAFEGVFDVFENGSLVGSGLTGPAQDGVMFWTPTRPIDQGRVIKVEFKALSGVPIVPVKSHLMVADTNG